MQITFDSNKDNLTEVIKLTKWLQNFKLEEAAASGKTPGTEQSAPPADASEGTGSAPENSVTVAGSSEAPKKRGRKPKAENAEAQAAGGATQQPPAGFGAPQQQAPQTFTAHSTFQQAPATATVETQVSSFGTVQQPPANVEPVYTAQQFYQVLVDLNKAGTFDPNKDMEGFCGEISAAAGKPVRNVVEITSEPAIIKIAFQVLKNHGLV